MVNILLCAAVIPVIFLGLFIYYKDKNKEPKGLLALIFFLGVLSVIPILICELTFDAIFPMSKNGGFIPIFINIFFGVALFEEFFKWLVTKLLGYNNKAFDEVFDIIVYSVFASLGFACLENIVYVFSGGFVVAIMRAVLSIPGHTCFAISMGYFFSKAKVAQINGNKKIYNRNIILSLLIPIILHTFYDAFLYNIDYETLTELIVDLLPFIIFFIAMVVSCFIVVDKVARVQQNLSDNLKNGSISRNEQGILYYNYQKTVPVQSNVVNGVGTINTVPNAPIVSQPSGVVISYCPICGKHVAGDNFCGRCGFRLK